MDGQQPSLHRTQPFYGLPNSCNNSINNLPSIPHLNLEKVKSQGNTTPLAPKTARRGSQNYREPPISVRDIQQKTKNSNPYYPAVFRSLAASTSNVNGWLVFSAQPKPGSRLKLPPRVLRRVKHSHVLRRRTGSCEGFGGTPSPKGGSVSISQSSPNKEHQKTKKLIECLEAFKNTPPSREAFNLIPQQVEELSSHIHADSQLLENHGLFIIDLFCALFESRCQANMDHTLRHCFFLARKAFALFEAYHKSYVRDNSIHIFDTFLKVSKRLARCTQKLSAMERKTLFSEMPEEETWDIEKAKEHLLLLERTPHQQATCWPQWLVDYRDNKDKEPSSIEPPQQHRQKGSLLRSNSSELAELFMHTQAVSSPESVEIIVRESPRSPAIRKRSSRIKSPENSRRKGAKPITLQMIHSRSKKKASEEKIDISVFTPLKEDADDFFSREQLAKRFEYYAFEKRVHNLYKQIADTLYRNIEGALLGKINQEEKNDLLSALRVAADLRRDVIDLNNPKAVKASSQFWLYVLEKLILDSIKDLQDTRAELNRNDLSFRPLDENFSPRTKELKKKDPLFIKASQAHEREANPFKRALYYRKKQLADKKCAARKTARVIREATIKLAQAQKTVKAAEQEKIKSKRSRKLSLRSAKRRFSAIQMLERRCQWELEGPKNLKTSPKSKKQPKKSSPRKIEQVIVNTLNLEKRILGFLENPKLTVNLQVIQLLGDILRADQDNPEVKAKALDLLKKEIPKLEKTLLEAKQEELKACYQDEIKELESSISRNQTRASTLHNLLNRIKTGDIPSTDLNHFTESLNTQTQEILREFKDLLVEIPKAQAGESTTVMLTHVLERTKRRLINLKQCDTLSTQNHVLCTETLRAIERVAIQLNLVSPEKPQPNSEKLKRLKSVKSLGQSRKRSQSLIQQAREKAKYPDTPRQIQESSHVSSSEKTKETTEKLTTLYYSLKSTYNYFHLLESIPLYPHYIPIFKDLLHTAKKHRLAKQKLQKDCRTLAHHPALLAHSKEQAQLLYDLGMALYRPEGKDAIVHQDIMSALSFINHAFKIDPVLHAQFESDRIVLEAQGLWDVSAIEKYKKVKRVDMLSLEEEEAFYSKLRGKNLKKAIQSTLNSPTFTSFFAPKETSANAQATTLCRLAYMQLTGDSVEADPMNAYRLFIQASEIGRINPQDRANFILERLYRKIGPPKETTKEKPDNSYRDKIKAFISKEPRNLSWVQKVAEDPDVQEYFLEDAATLLIIASQVASAQQSNPTT